VYFIVLHNSQGCLRTGTRDLNHPISGRYKNHFHHCSGALYLKGRRSFIDREVVRELQSNYFYIKEEIYMTNGALVLRRSVWGF
jgi:hypothetical protein